MDSEEESVPFFPITHFTINRHYKSQAISNCFNLPINDLISRVLITIENLSIHLNFLLLFQVRHLCCGDPNKTAISTPNKSMQLETRPWYFRCFRLIENYVVFFPFVSFHSLVLLRCVRDESFDMQRS